LPGWIFLLIGLELIIRYQPKNNWAPKIKELYQEYGNKFQEWRKQSNKEKLIN
jgi:hypothetical protein